MLVSLSLSSHSSIVVHDDNVRKAFDRVRAGMPNNKFEVSCFRFSFGGNWGREEKPVKIRTRF